MERVKWSELSERERDALVAEKVMGYVEGCSPCGDGLTRTHVYDGSTMEEVNSRIQDAYQHHVEKGMRLWPAQYEGPSYSTEVTAAWEVWNAFHGSDYDKTIQNCCEGIHDYCAFLFSHNEDKDDAEGNGPICDALCIAALRAVGVEVED